MSESLSHGDRRLGKSTCVVCGASPTVKSHIVPRALFHAMKRLDHQLIGPRADGPGYRVLQSGSWCDTILCDAHESLLGDVDRYGVAFCRDFMRRLKEGQEPIEIANPRPDLLVLFASACVWRMAAARTDGQPEKWLGPYAKRLSAALFEQAPFDTPLLLSRHAYQIKRGEIMNLSLMPHPHSELGIKFWRFIVCGLIFDLKMDNRAVPYAMSIFPINNRNVVTVFDDLPQNPLRSQTLGPALHRLAIPPRSQGQKTEREH